MSMLQSAIRLPGGMIGVAANHFDGLSFIHKFGANFDIDNNSEPETVWTGGGLYPWDAFDTEQTLYVASSSENDDAQLLIEGLDADYYEISETVTLNGTNSVQTTSLFKRVSRMIYDDGSTNEGTLTARAGASDGTLVAQVDAGFSQTLMCVYTVPANNTAYLMAGDFSVQKNKDAQVKFFVRPEGKSFRIAHMAEVFESSYRYDFPIPLPIPEKTDLEVRADNVENNSTRVTANFDLLLETN